MDTEAGRHPLTDSQQRNPARDKPADEDNDMTIKLSEQQVLSLDWQVVGAYWDHIQVGHIPTYDHHPEFGEVEKDPGQRSLAAGGVIYEAQHDGQTLRLAREAEGMSTGSNTHADLYEWEVSAPDHIEPYTLDGFVVVDSDGDDMLKSELAGVYEELDDRLGDLSDIMPGLLERPEPQDIDIDEDNDMQTYTLTRDDDRDVRFQGERVASASSHHYQGPRNIRWTELRLYRTASGRLICEEVGRSLWEGESDRHHVYTADDDQELIEKVGTGWLAKELYEDAGIECVEEIA